MRACALLASLGLSFLAPALAQDASSVEIETGADRPAGPAEHPSQGRKIAYVRVLGRWADQVPPTLVPGERLTPEKLALAMEALAAAINASNASVPGLASRGELAVLRIEVEFDLDPRAEPGAEPWPEGAAIGVTFRPFQVSVSLEHLGDNVLPVPRSALPTFYANVPAPLLALNPRFGMSYDRAFGTAVGGGIDGEVLSLLDAARSADGGPPRQRLDVHAAGVAAVDGPFYRGDAGLRYVFRPAGSALREASLRLNAASLVEPQAGNEHARQVAALGAGLTFRLAPTTRLSLDAGLQNTSDSVRPLGTPSGPATVAREQTGRLLLDSLPPPFYGFLRAAAWADHATLSDDGGSYRRFAARAGYAKEIALQPNQTVGLEVQVGGGSLSGAAPTYAQFYGGNSPVQFMYDSAGSTSLLGMPSGPLLRSLGQGQAGLQGANGSVVGGSRFWHVNLDLALPVARWSRPLIPNELTDLEDSQGNAVSLKQILRRQVDVSGPAMLSETLKAEGLSAEEAQRQADAALAEIRPAVHFIIDDANVFSVRPLLLLDVAGLSGGEGATSARWVGLGAGIAVTVVTARFEAGYMQTLSGPTYGLGRGAAFFRLVFQNLF